MKLYLILTLISTLIYTTNTAVANSNELELKFDSLYNKWLHEKRNKARGYLAEYLIDEYFDILNLGPNVIPIIINKCKKENIGEKNEYYTFSVSTIIQLALYERYDFNSSSNHLEQIINIYDINNSLDVELTIKNILVKLNEDNYLQFLKEVTEYGIIVIPIIIKHINETKKLFLIDYIYKITNKCRYKIERKYDINYLNNWWNSHKSYYNIYK